MHRGLLKRAAARGRGTAMLLGYALVMLLTGLPAASASAQERAEPAGTRQRRVAVPYEEGMVIPPGRSYLRSHDRRLQRVAGVLLFTGAYVASAVGRTVVSARRDQLHFRALLPVVGAPWAAYHDRRRRAAGIMGLLVQSMGLATLLFGVFGAERELVHYTAGGRRLRADVAPVPGGAQLSLQVF